MLEINLIASGIAGTVAGAVALTQKRLRSGVRYILAGLSAINIGGGLSGVSAGKQSEVMKCTLAAVTGIIGVSGALQLVQGIKQRSLSQIVKGIVRTCASVAGTALVCSLDSRVIIVAQQACVLGLASSFIGVLGLKDVAKGQYRSGLCKMAVGITGMAAVVLCVHTANQATVLLGLPASTHPKADLPTAESRLSLFLDFHRREIEAICSTKTEVGAWRCLGSGISKVTFGHPGLPGWVIKTPKQNDPWHYSYLNLAKHSEVIEYVRAVADSFNRIYIPKSYELRLNTGCYAVIEEALNLRPYYVRRVEDREAKRQFDVLVGSTGLCDVEPDRPLDAVEIFPHNAGVIIGSNPPVIGIVDFDCIRK
ncbi:MAG: hypothetical protein RL235_976 [Chlamydiota bacterium]|jgi:hypothetical protein